jgi:hypothetical protein
LWGFDSGMWAFAPPQETAGQRRQQRNQKTRQTERKTLCTADGPCVQTERRARLRTAVRSTVSAGETAQTLSSNDYSGIPTAVQLAPHLLSSGPENHP